MQISKKSNVVLLSGALLASLIFVYAYFAIFLAPPPEYFEKSQYKGERFSFVGMHENERIIIEDKSSSCRDSKGLYIVIFGQGEKDVALLDNGKSWGHQDELRPPLVGFHLTNKIAVGLESYLNLVRMNSGSNDSTLRVHFEITYFRDNKEVGTEVVVDNQAFDTMFDFDEETHNLKFRSEEVTGYKDPRFDGVVTISMLEALIKDWSNRSAERSAQWDAAIGASVM